MDKTVLLVDDSATIRQMVGLTLKQAGFTTFEGSNGEEGLQQLAVQNVSLIITDLNMPMMDGLAFIRAARTRPECKFIPILMLTIESQEEKKRAGRAAGATGWIVKPFEPQKLLDTISEVLP